MAKRPSALAALIAVASASMLAAAWGIVPRTAGWNLAFTSAAAAALAGMLSARAAAPRRCAGADLRRAVAGRARLRPAAPGADRGARLSGRLRLGRDADPPGDDRRLAAARPRARPAARPLRHRDAGDRVHRLEREAARAA